MAEDNVRRLFRPGVQLERAMLCSDCETISDVGSLSNGRCPHCGSISPAAMSNWLKRPDLVPRIVDTARRY